MLSEVDFLFSAENMLLFIKSEYISKNLCTLHFENSFVWVYAWKQQVILKALFSRSHSLSGCLVV